MRIYFTDVVCDNSLRHIFANGKKVECKFDIQPSCYCGHFLLVIDELAVTVDGEEITEADMRFCIHDREFGIVSCMIWFLNSGGQRSRQPLKYSKLYEEDKRGIPRMGFFTQPCRCQPDLVQHLAYPARY